MSTAAVAQSVDPELDHRVYRKINLRILPLVLVCYSFAYLDRINIGFAKLQMTKAINIDEAAYGLGAGLFFLSYVVFEIPSNLLMTKVGARRTISRILFLWGLTSASMMFVRDETSFYVVRLLLGAFEAGFAPGIILYLTYWYSRRRMGTAMAVYMIAAPLGSAVGAPLSTFILSRLDGAGGLAGWQWMFLVEGLPCVLLAVAVLFIMADRPKDAPWLTAEEKAYVEGQVATEEAEGKAHRFADALRNWRVYTMALGYFALISGLYTISFWLPTILRDNGVRSTMQIGWLTAVPYLLATVAMVLYGRRSDSVQERRWHSVVPALLGTLALLGAAYTGRQLLLSYACLVLATVLLQMAYTVFWTVPSEYFAGTAAAGGIALINSIGLLGGFVSPFIIGAVKQSTGSIRLGLLAMVAILVVGTICLTTIKGRSAERRAEVLAAR